MLQDLLVTEPDLAAGLQHTKLLIMEATCLLEACSAPNNFWVTVTATTQITGSMMQDLLVTEPDLAAGFQHTKFLVMDEADRLLEASFEPDLRAILTKLPAKRQTLLFSATMTKNLVALQKAVLRDAYHFQVCYCTELQYTMTKKLLCCRVLSCEMLTTCGCCLILICY